MTSLLRVIAVGGLIASADGLNQLVEVHEIGVVGCLVILSVGIQASYLVAL